jgi:hypothetical protein
MKRSTKFNRDPRRAPLRRLTAGRVLCACLAVTVGVLPATSFAQCVRQADGSIVCTPRQPVRRFVQAVTPRYERSIVRSYTVTPQSYGSSGATSYGSQGGVTYSTGSTGGVTYSAPTVRYSRTVQTTNAGDCPCGPDCQCCKDLEAENADLRAEVARLRGELAATKATSTPVSKPEKFKRPAPPKYSSLFGPPAWSTLRPVMVASR